MKTRCVQCWKLFINGAAAKAHADVAHPPVAAEDMKELRRKGWATPYGCGDWSEPITYAEACKQMQEMHSQILQPERPPHDR